MLRLGLVYLMLQLGLVYLILQLGLVYLMLQLGLVYLTLPRSTLAGWLRKEKLLVCIQEVFPPIQFLLSIDELIGGHLRNQKRKFKGLRIHSHGYLWVLICKWLPSRKHYVKTDLVGNKINILILRSRD